MHPRDSEMVYFFWGPGRPERSGGGSQAVERRPLERSEEDESRSCLLVSYRPLASPHSRNKNVL